MMATIYIVTSGEYSDYGIEAVFDSREKAQAFLDYTQKLRSPLRGAPEIEEWELNKHYDPISRGLVCYRVFFEDIHQGTANRPVDSVSLDADGVELTGLRANGRQWYQTYVWTTDEAAALKIANERRARYLVEHP